MSGEIKVIRCKGKEYTPYVNDDGIYAPVAYSDQVYYQRIMTKEMFVEAYNKWIKNDTVSFVGQDDADDWSED
jgi:hypothetical protein